MKHLKFLPVTLSLLFAIAVVCFSLLHAEEGMWPIDHLSKELIREMQAKGLSLSDEELYTTDGKGVINAVVDLGGGTGSFVSPEGLIITNHHVAFGAIQQMSTAENNYIEKGFLAKTREDEPQALGFNAYVLLSSKDVTEEVLSYVNDSMSPLERFNAVEQAQKEIVKEAEEGRDVFCEVAAMYGGLSYTLYTYLKIKDLRVVYVPPASIGNYGGDIDNWMWPRHTGDFSFLRAYVAPNGKTAEYSEENVPYRPKSYLKIASEPTREGDFALVAGYPGHTYRHVTSYTIENDINFYYPTKIDIFNEWTNIIADHAARDPEAGVKMAGLKEGLENSKKNAHGMLEGFQRYRLLDRKLHLEEEFKAFLAGDAQMEKEYGHILPEIKSQYDHVKSYQLQRMLFSYIKLRGLFQAAYTIYKWNVEQEKTDLERDPDYMERELPDIRRKLQNLDRKYHPAVDRDMLVMFLRRMAALPAGRRIQAVDEILAGVPEDERDVAINEFVDALYSGTRLTDVEARLAMLDSGTKHLVEEGDPFILFAAQLYPEVEELQERRDAFDGALSVLRPQWVKALMEWQKQALYPDANNTLRINYGVVRGYAPRDAVSYESFTTLDGVLEKYRGEDPFDLPPQIFELVEKQDFGPYRDPVLNDVPVDFLTTNDSTGGNSGSPLLNHKGELIGLLFDGNYESISADFMFIEEMTRTINVDIRYVLFIADKLNNARNVLQEMGVLE
ncbi:MAG: S46 family peptidase [Gemmatimonadota bacterium]|nr:MAG: S46 family peptidase [Gemmatimonadota bacterium]